jgi:cytochrome c
MKLLTLKRWIAATALAGCGMGWAVQPAAAMDGKELFAFKGCPTCHGPEGGAPILPNYPKLKGQNADYLTIQLKAFRSGERKGPQVALMQPMALTLSDEETVLIAKYLNAAQ